MPYNNMRRCTSLTRREILRSTLTGACLWSVISRPSVAADAKEPVTPAFWTSRLADVDAAVRQVRKGRQRLRPAGRGRRVPYRGEHQAPAHRV